jgi:MFS family permease
MSTPSPNQQKKSEPAAASIWSGPFVILLVANFFQSMSAFMANTTIPLYLDSMGATAGSVGVVVSAFAITALLIRPFAGPAFDSFSRRRLLIAAQLVNASAFVLYGFVDSLGAFFAVRLLHGIGIGCSGPLAMSLVSDYIPVAKFATGMSVYSLAQSFAQVIGPGAGLWLVGIIGYQGTYLISAALLVLSVLGVARVVEKQRKRPPYQLKLSRMFAREALDKAVVVALFAMAFGATISYLVLYGTKLGIGNIGMYFVVYALCLLITRPLYGRLADTFGAERVLIPGVLFFGVSYVMLSRITDFAGLMAVAVVAAAGFGACMPLVQSLAMSSVPPERRGAASNTVFTGMDLGSLLGPLFSGLAIEALQPAVGNELAAYSDMWLVMMVPQVIALVVIVFWNVRSTRNRKQE